MVAPKKHRRTVCRRPGRRGFSMLEVMIGCTLMAVAITPALVLVRDHLEMGRTLATREMMETQAAAQMERALAIYAADFQEFSTAGAVSETGFGTLRYKVVGTTASGSGGAADALLAITSTVWHDADHDSVQDGDEDSAVIATKLARMTLYEEAAQ
jgi:Tfp pilus assembly protein PilV